MRQAAGDLVAERPADTRARPPTTVLIDWRSSAILDNTACKTAAACGSVVLATLVCIVRLCLPPCSEVRNDPLDTMTVYKPVTIEAERAAEEAVRLAKGEKAHADGTANNGKIKVPAIMLKPVVVTKDNIKTTVVKDGFQKLKSINEALSADQQIK